MYAGHGLAIPHASVAGASDVHGVLGISAEGLEGTTRDGARVHAVLLLAVPEGQGAPHVEIAAALGRAVGSDAALEQSLYTAPNAARAFAILHAFDDPDLNTMLARLDRVALDSDRPGPPAE
jgi:mannitol/fructose-specific phosphotransferase system IIA component (Ntr-type)